MAELPMNPDCTLREKYREVDLIMALVAEECNKPTPSRSMMLSRCQVGIELVDNLIEADHSPGRRTSLVVLKQFLKHIVTIMSVKKDTLDKSKPCAKQDLSKQTSADADSRRQAIEGMAIQQKTISFENISGLNEAKQILREAITFPDLYPHFFKDGLKPWRCILLYGPPGTGKTCLALAIALEIKVKFYSVSSSDLVSSLFGETEKMIKALFQQARSQQGKCVLFIDEVDSLCRKRKSSEEEHVRRIKTELLRQMEGDCTHAVGDRDKLFLICATNCPWDLDTAFVRRFQRRICIPLPNRLARRDIIGKCIGSQEVNLSHTFMETLVDLTEGFSGSDICNAVSDALFQPIRHTEKATAWVSLPGGKVTPCSPDTHGAKKATLRDISPEKVQLPKLTFMDLRSALMKAHATVTKEEVNQFNKFTAEFGSCGS
ncbi:uncharacterized protein LOC144949585 isoform X1 [Lampetra fluviatilis]